MAKQTKVPMICRIKSGGCGKEIAFVRVQKDRLTAFADSNWRVRNEQTTKAIHVDELATDSQRAALSNSYRIILRRKLEESCAAKREQIANLL